MNFCVFCISCLLYSLLIIGLILAFYNSFCSLWGWISLRRRLTERSEKKKTGVVAKLSLLVFSASGKENKGSILALSEVLILAFVFYVASLYFGTFLSLIIGLLAASVPILSLVSKIQTQRSKSSSEAPGFVSELYRQYRIENKNMYSALEKVAGNTKDYPVCAKQSYYLLLRLRTGLSKDAAFYCREFAFSLGSLWGRSAANCIYSAVRGTDVSNALLELLDQIKETEKEQEEKRRLNSEAYRMTVFLVPAMYILSCFACIKYLGMTPAKVFKNQFLEPSGILLFMLISFFFFANCIILRTVNNSKPDI